VCDGKKNTATAFFPATPMLAVPFRKSPASDTEQSMDHAVAACLIRTGRDGHRCPYQAGAVLLL
jgi:hypothetical protein